MIKTKLLKSATSKIRVGNHAVLSGPSVSLSGNSYSFHQWEVDQGGRTPQVYTLYGSGADQPDPVNLTAWTKITDVDSRPNKPGAGWGNRPQGVQIADSAGVDLGKFRYLLFVVKPTLSPLTQKVVGAGNTSSHTFFTEIDVHSATTLAASKPAGLTKSNVEEVNRDLISTFDSKTPADAVIATPSLEARNPLLAVAATGTGTQLPATHAGLTVSRQGALVTAFGQNPDGPGTLLRVWEQTGITGDLTVSLGAPASADSSFTTATPVNLRGEKSARPLDIKNGKLTINLHAYAPASFLLN